MSQITDESTDIPSALLTVLVVAAMGLLLYLSLREESWFLGIFTAVGAFTIIRSHRIEMRNGHWRRY